LIKGGRSVNFGRKVALLICACCVVPVALVTQMAKHVDSGDCWSVSRPPLHQGWSANLFTTASDMFPKRAVGSIVGLGGMARSAGSHAHSENHGVRAHQDRKFYGPLYYRGLGLSHFDRGDTSPRATA
jgi:ACS family hexuronate transporter-like MFS transporter